MDWTFSRRRLLKTGASMLALGALPQALAQPAKTKLRFSSAFTEQDIARLLCCKHCHVRFSGMELVYDEAC